MFHNYEREPRLLALPLDLVSGKSAPPTLVAEDATPMTH